MAMQLDTWLQSPQPSQTRSLITIRRVGDRQPAALAQPAGLRRAELVEDDGGDAGNAAQPLLDLAQPVARSTPTSRGSDRRG